MKLRKLSAATAILASGALILSACTPGEENGDTPDTGATGNDAAGEATTGAEGQQYTVDPTDGTRADFGDDFETNSDTIYVSMGAVPFENVNGNTAASYNTYNSAVVGRISSGFVYFGTDLTVNPNEEFGSFEVTQEADTVYVEDEDGNPVLDEETGEPQVDEEASTPMIVEYTISEDAVWSDGTPITAADYMLDWHSQNLAGEDGAGFDPVSTSLPQYVPGGIQAESHDSKTFTVEFPAFYADWQLLISGPGVPAHVLAELSDMSLDELLDALESGDVDESVAENWNTGFGFEGDWDEDIALSSGPYVLSDWNPGESVTLTANPEWWGTPAGTETLIFQFIDDSQHVQALENGDLDVIAPQPDADIRQSLTNLADAGQAVLHEGEIATWEHLDLQWKDGSVFSETPELAEAFALCVPRQQIVENLIQPVNPEAEVLNAREIFNFSPGYDEFVAESYDGRYDEVDIERASEIVEEAGAEGTTIRIYHSGVPRRHDTVSLIAASCGEAGLEIEDMGDPEGFGANVVEGDYEVALFAWAGSGQIVSGRNIYHSSAGGQNWNGYSNETVDELWDVVASDVSDDERTEALIEIEQNLWEDLHGIPLYVHPGLNASDATIYNVRQTAAQDQIVWNADQWQRAE